MKQDILLRQQLKEISTAIQNNYKEEKNIGVLSGISGLALFQFYYAKFIDDDLQADIAVEMISACIERINDGFSYPTYCDGIAGFGWAVDHLVTEGFIDIDCDELLEPFDTYLFAQMESNLSIGKYDFLHGAIGYGFYFLKRYEHTNDSNLKARYSDYLLKLLEGLDKLSVSEGNFVKWESVFDHEKGTKVSNLSLSHGMASIVSFLTRTLELQLHKKIANRLLLGSVSYILNFQSTENTLSKFPDVVENIDAISYQSRLAWCYGDLGIGISLLRASEVIEDVSIRTRALAVLEYNSKRRNEEQTMVMDAGLCHGSFGNSQIFRNMQFAYPNVEFDKTSNFWIEEGIKRSCFKDGYAGYKLWHGTTNSWKSSISLLEGVAGIGLSIIDALSEKQNNWDECLMIS